MASRAFATPGSSREPSAWIAWRRHAEFGPFMACSSHHAVGISIVAVFSTATRGSTVVLVGNVSPMIDLPLQAVVTRQLRLQGSCASAGCYPEAIRLVASGRVDLSGFVSRVAPLAEGPAWFDRLHHREPGLVKVVLEP